MLIDRNVLETALEFLSEQQLKIWLQGCFDTFIGSNPDTSQMNKGCLKLYTQAAERIEADVEANTSKVLRNREIGRKGGRPIRDIKNPEVIEEKPNGYENKPTGYFTETQNNPSTVQYSTVQSSSVQQPSVVDAREEKKEPSKQKKEIQIPPPVADAPPTREDVIEFFASKGFPEAHAIKAYEYYHPTWVDSRGAPVLNWKQRFMTTWMKDSDKGSDPNTVNFSEIRNIIKQQQQ